MKAIMNMIWRQGILVLGLCLLFSVAVYGQGGDGEPDFRERSLPRLVDDAGLLSQEEEETLLSQLDEISERQQFDVVVVTVDSLNGQYIEQFADDFFDANGYGFGDGHDGILFVISMGEREWGISTSGFGEKAFTDAGQEYIRKQFLPDLSDGNYYDAFAAFAKWADAFVTEAKEGKPYDEGHLPVTASNILFCVLVGLLVGFALAFLRVWIMKWQMRTVYHRSEASDYLVDGSCQIQDSRERLVRRTVNRIRIERQDHSGGGSGGGGSTTHTSSSGRSHGGSHGNF